MKIKEYLQKPYDESIGSVILFCFFCFAIGFMLGGLIYSLDDSRTKWRDDVIEIKTMLIDRQQEQIEKCIQALEYSNKYEQGKAVQDEGGTITKPDINPILFTDIPKPEPPCDNAHRGMQYDKVFICMKKDNGYKWEDVSKLKAEDQ